jgi:hypothetical protein
MSAQPPKDNDEVKRQYRIKSAITNIHNATNILNEVMKTPVSAVQAREIQKALAAAQAAAQAQIDLGTKKVNTEDDKPTPKRPIK